MQFEKVEMTIPKEVKEFYDFLYTCDEEVRIIGTYLIERYQKRLSFHVHLIANRTFFFETIQAVCDHFHIDFKRLRLSTYSCEFLYKGYCFELYFIEQPEEEVYLQDIRLNEIVYYQNETVASKECLQDLNDKMIRTGIVKEPLDTLIRLFDYQQRFSFKLDRDSIHSFMEQFNEKSYTANYVKEYVQKNTSNELAQTMISQMKLDNSDSQVKFTLTKENPNALFYLKQHHYRIHRNVFDALYNKNDFFEKEAVYTFSEMPGMKKIRSLQEEIKKEFRKNKVKLLFHFPKETPGWMNESDNLLFLSHVLPQIMKKAKKETKELKTMVQTIQHLNKTIELVSGAMLEIPSTMKIKITTNVVLNYSINPDDYLNNEYVMFDFENKWSLTLHKPTNKISKSSNISEEIQSILQDVMDELLEGEKQNEL